MKNKASGVGLLRQILATLSRMAKAKTLSLKSKTRVIKTRLIIFSLLSKQKFLMSSLSQSIQQRKSSISHKLHALLGHHGKHPNDEDDAGGQSKAIVPYKDNINAMANESLPDPTQTELLEEKNHLYLDEVDEEDDDKYPDLTHSLFKSEDMDFEDPGGSVIDLVKNSREEVGKEFSLEDEIDRVADLFIRRFHRQMRMQKQPSFKMCQDQMPQRSA
ncbi:hypothetical protein CJ030_MR0G006833 [Morella rubra]|uniref:DUF761 domain-containing protein n=1 Tax=Morella rubra TaxID=262757 RepID=A0A6A1UK21_9ROSI|nr:hypothetical protein CJ030_MR0G006833 [Morella rubra]